MSYYVPQRPSRTERTLGRVVLGSVVLAFKARRAWVLGSGAVGDVARRVGRRPA